ncbi:hypothetical protein SEA_GIBBOUS_68 [Gordonia phage Gibbous]|uniref:Uncharacterized protein n=1 Tax=Gordonia phage Gibbous TaxID=2652405 RepID=A0A5J6T3Y6_9CAUD|nr:hypothetical protein QLQ74_gp68 [Gordonia phage Gibbous]QFG05144.1 hypothetical protein SEA_GIBBOUS_68 [Gordonia phage Gibbous]
MLTPSVFPSRLTFVAFGAQKLKVRVRAIPAFSTIDDVIDL